MGLIINRKIAGDVQLGVWKIEESTDQLLEMLDLTTMEEKIYQSLRTEERKKQWLSYRVTIKKLLNLNKVLDINYDKKGKPKILNHYLHVSVTHSGEFSAAILHKNMATGIDIEKLTGRIHKIKSKFLSDKELQEIQQYHNDYTEALHVYWGAKEVIYKMQSIGIISLRENIYIHPFNYEDDKIVYGSLIYNSRNSKFELVHECIEDYILVYSMDSYRHFDSL